VAAIAAGSAPNDRFLKYNRIAVSACWSIHLLAKNTIDGTRLRQRIIRIRKQVRRKIVEMFTGDVQ
jgi:hypothetical protein